MWLQEIASDEPGQATLFDQAWARALMRQSKRLHHERARADGMAGERRLELLERRFGHDQAIRDIAADWGCPPRRYTTPSARLEPSSTAVCARSSPSTLPPEPTSTRSAGAFSPFSAAPGEVLRGFCDENGGRPEGPPEMTMDDERHR